MDGLSDGEGTMENKNRAKGKWTAWGKVRATSFFFFFLKGTFY